ncbi:MAG: sigma-54-dependent Fis family transcriptional regulator [Labilithrix sp.]|nr:sigma-54-dependent Fis family transcriptional regulator [Labilithrix sp.]MBX3222842.1 sigma-54-dependent Fis family transcriptional regulator [Labilithrix sp.]
MGWAVERSVSAGRVLLVEDDPAERHGIAASLRARRYDVLEAASCEDAIELFALRPDIVITDLRLPDGDAVSLLPRLRAVDSTVPVYVMTGFATIDVAVRTVKLGAAEFFTKPVEMARLIGCVDHALRREPQRNVSGERRRARVDHLAPLADRFLPASDVMRRLEDEIEGLRDSDCTVLVLGETGTGKTHLARRIHQLGARSSGPFVDVNCAGLSREFFESELFGHERGAFTGALASKQGLFDAANGGTLFLDEIGDIDVQVQPKILKVLEEKRFRRMGDVRERSADVRLVAATHHELLTAVEQRTFRADLFYRISTVTLRVPSLRERTADLVPLVEHVLAQEGAPNMSLTREAWDKIEAHPWPGNIRELKNVLRRALILRRGEVITADNVRFDGDARTSSSALEAAPASEPVPSGTLEEVEREHIARVLAAENGRVKDAARRLGIPRSTLYQKIKNYRIPLPARARTSAPPSSSSGG